MRNWLRIFYVFAMFCAFTPREVGAATITVDGTGMRSLQLAISGSPVPVDSRVMVGYFDGLTDPEIIADQGNPEFLESTFVAFGSGGVVGEGTGEPPSAGFFTFSTSATVEPPSPTFIEPSPPNNQQIYIWTFDSNNLPTDAAHQAIFTSTLPNWRWPTTDDGLTDTSISLDDSLSMLVGASSSDAVFMVAIPEPGSWALFGFGMIGLLAVASAYRRLTSDHKYLRIRDR
jgi:PEP-CTERM motif